MSNCKDPENRSKKKCVCGGHNTKNKKSNKLCSSTKKRLEIRASRLAKETNMEDTIITTDIERGYKKCLCCVCGCIEICTPENDFYNTEEHDGLLCERCMQEYTKTFMKEVAG